ncbi:hypothetical protein ACIBHY_29970 [Nonomuraea sp. NPDC050547]|uniref:hypothetical protein n=1 Tax=Nonomuraea sp. NPDC050547 TaxID=3364368 RepID=UPI0037962BFE
MTLAPGCICQSDPIDLVDLKETTSATTGWSAIRAVLTRLIADRNRVCEAFANVALEFDGLTGYVEHRGVDAEDLFEVVHDTAAAQPATLTTTASISRPRTWSSRTGRP